MTILIWKKVRGGYEASSTNGTYEVVRLIRRGYQLEFQLYVDGDEYGGASSYRDCKDIAQFLEDDRVRRSGRS